MTPFVPLRQVRRMTARSSVVDVVLTADPTDNISVWANFDWVNVNGSDNVDGNLFGAAAAGRVGLTDTIGFATRLEYVHTSNHAHGPR